MKIKITLDNLNNAISQLEDLKRKIESFTHDIAEESASRIAYPNVRPSHSGEHHTITATSPAGQIAFEEFGAGYDADVIFGFDEYGGEGFYNEPGIYSRDHAGTFQKHLQSGEPPNTYRYNRMPKRYMQNEAQRLMAETEQKAKEYFS